MATSGTIGTTVIDTATVIDHAVRRCGQAPSTLTPESLDMARENLYLILTSLINRGMNLWCIDELNIGLQTNQATYTLPAGTVDIINMNYVTGTQEAFTGAQDPQSYTATFTNPVAIKTIGMYFNANRTNNFVVEVSNDGTTWAAIKQIPQFIGYAGTWYWYDLDPSYVVPYLRIREFVANTITAPVSFSQVVMMSSTYQRPIADMSRDTYDALPVPTLAGVPTQYLLDKQITPVVHLYPVPTDVYAHLSFSRQRYVQDVGQLSNKLEIPERWFESIIWLLSKNMAFELPQVDPTRLQLCVAMADKYLSEAEDGETDGAPIYMRPNISGYTK